MRWGRDTSEAMSLQEHKIVETGHLPKEGAKLRGLEARQEPGLPDHHRTLSPEHGELLLRRVLVDCCEGHRGQQVLDILLLSE